VAPKHVGAALKRFSGSGVIALVFLWAAPSYGDAKENAKAHFTRALELAEKHAYGEALVEFQRAQELSPNLETLYNIGQAYLELGKAVDAVDTLTRYLAEGHEQISPARRSMIEAMIKEQAALIGEVVLSVEPAGAQVLVDGRDVGTSPLSAPVRVGIGEHRVVASMQGYGTVDRSIRVGGGERRELALALAAVAPVATITPAPSSAEPAKRDVTLDAGTTDDSPPVFAYAIGAAGLVVAGVGAAFGVTALGNDRDVDRLCPTHRDCSSSALDAAADRDRNAWIANVGVGLGSVGIATSVILLLTRPRNDKSESASAAKLFITPVGQGLRVHGTF
jgi:hypothetical protein